MDQTPEREPVLSRKVEYMRSRRAAVAQIYFKDEAEKHAFQAAAAASGYRVFSKWVIQTLHDSAAGLTYPAGYVPGLEADLRKSRELVRLKDEQINELHRDLRLAETAREDLRVILSAIAECVPEAAAKLYNHERNWQSQRGGELR